MKPAMLADRLNVIELNTIEDEAATAADKVDTSKTQAKMRPFGTIRDEHRCDTVERQTGP